MIVGFDEVGRGALAGPVTVGLCGQDSSLPRLNYKNGGVFNKRLKKFEIVNDSKKLKLKDRQRVVALAQDFDLQSYVLSASNKLIDECGVGVCLSHLLMLGVQLFDLESRFIADGQIKILENLDKSLVKKISEENKLKKEFDLEIGKKVLSSKVNLKRESKADEKYLSVGIASNLAKVERDQYMTELGKQYSEYGWGRNVGYATKQNRSAIAENPYNDYLRKTFCGNILSQKNS